MNKIKLNNTEFIVEGYNKNTYFNGETVTSSGTCNIITDNMSSVESLADNTITSIQIIHDDELIYNLTNINARIESINEYLNTDHMSININLIFDILI